MYITQKFLEVLSYAMQKIVYVENFQSGKQHVVWAQSILVKAHSENGWMDGRYFLMMLEGRVADFWGWYLDEERIDALQQQILKLHTNLFKKHSATVKCIIYPNRH